MPYVLVIIFIASQPPRLDHVDSIRFDNEEACMAVLHTVNNASATLATMRGIANPVTVECAPAKISQ
jgi:hypothetical protein